MKRRITALLAASYIAAAMSMGAFAASAGEGAAGAVSEAGDAAGGVVENVGEGISQIADGIGDAANDVLDGVGNAAEEITGGETDAAEEEIVVNDEEDPGVDEVNIAEMTDDDDVDDDLEDNPEDDDNTKVYEVELSNGGSDNRNPATGGLPFMTAGLVAVTAAGVAYLTKKRNTENGQG